MILLATANRKHLATETDRTHLDTGSGSLRKCNGRWVGQWSYNPSPIFLGWNKVSTKHIISHVCRSVNFVWWPIVTSIAFAHPLILIQGWHNSCAMAKKGASKKQKAKKQENLARASKDFEWVESNMGMNIFKQNRNGILETKVNVGRSCYNWNLTQRPHSLC